MRIRIETNTRYAKFCLRGSLLAFALGGITPASEANDISQSPNAIVRYTQVTAAIARDRWESIQSLHSEGHATVQELHSSEQAYRLSLAGVEEAIAQSNTPEAQRPDHAPFVIQLTSAVPADQPNGATASPPNQPILVHLPGLSRHKATRRFSTLLVSGVDLLAPATDADDFTISAAPRRDLIKKKISVQEELIRRLTHIRQSADSSTKELEHAQLRLEQLIAERDMTLPLTIVTRPDTSRNDTIPAAFHTPSTDDDHQAIQAAIQAAQASVDQASAVVQHSKRVLTEHSRRLKLLNAVSDDPLVSHSEIEREQLLFNAATASLCHARESLQCRQSELRYLQVLASTEADIFQSPRLHDAVLDLLKNHSNRSSAKDEWTAKSKYLEWKLAAIESLYEEGHASWWEKSQAELAVAEAAAAQLQADNQLAVAKRTLTMLEKALPREASLPQP